MTKGTIRVLHSDLKRYEVETITIKWDRQLQDFKQTIYTEVVSLTEKIRKEREKTLTNVMKKLSKKNITIISTEVTSTHTIINYEVLS